MIDVLKPVFASSVVVGAGAALAVGFGFVPSNADLARVEAQASKVATIQTDVAVLTQRVETIEKAVARIETAQTIHFDKLMNKIEKVQR